MRDLALWPPYYAAKGILAQAFFPELQAGFDPQAPRDLLPGTGVYPTERALSRQLQARGITPFVQIGDPKFELHIDRGYTVTVLYFSNTLSIKQIIE